MQKEKIVDKIKEFFKPKNQEIEVMILEDVANKISYEVRFKEPIQLSEEEYRNLQNLITGLHFSIIDSWETIGDYTYERKSYLGVEEYQNKDETEIDIFYTRVWTKNDTIYFLDKIWIE